MNQNIPVQQKPASSQNKNILVFVMIAFVIIISVLAIALGPNSKGSKSGFFAKARPTPSPIQTPKQTPTPTPIPNKILAIYELENNVVFATEKPTTATFLKSGSEEYLTYGVSFDSGKNGFIIKKGMSYQIKLDGPNTPTHSDWYYFQGKRAVIDYPVCPFEQYINSDCKLEPKEDTSLFTEASDKKVLRDNQRRSDLIKIHAALEKYHADNGSYPQSLSEISENFPDGIPSDPKTNEQYRYKTAGASPQSFRLCIAAVTFEASLPTEDYCLSNTR